MALAQLASEPTARNSKRFPVKANGDVRLRSVLSINNSGIWEYRVSYRALPPKAISSSVELSSKWSSTLLNWLPKKEEMMAGGASLAPRRCVGCSWWKLSAIRCGGIQPSGCWRWTWWNAGSLPSLSRSHQQGTGICTEWPVVVFTEPLTPLNGFRAAYTEPCVRATFRINDMMSMLWSTARLHSSKKSEPIQTGWELPRCDVSSPEYQFQCLDFKVFHESCHTGGDSAEVMVFQLLVLEARVPSAYVLSATGSGRAAYKPSSPGSIPVPIPSKPSLFYIRVEIVANVYCCFVDCTEGFQQRSFVVEWFTGIGNKDGWNAQLSSTTNTGDEGSHALYPRASKVLRIPRSGKDEASGSCCTRIFGRILPSCHLFRRVLRMHRVFGCSFCQWLEPVSIMGSTSSLAHRFIPAATSSAMSLSILVPRCPWHPPVGHKRCWADTWTFFHGWTRISRNIHSDGRQVSHGLRL